MTRKISEVYDETINAINKLHQGMALKEKEEILTILKNNKDYFGLTINPYVMTLDELKKIPIWIMNHIEMYKRGHDLVTFSLMKQKIAEEPDFLERFNF